MSILYGVENLSVLDGATHVAFDTETTGLRPTPGGLRLLQLAAERCGVVVIDLWELDQEELRELQVWCAETPRMWYAHNAVFDLGWLQEHRVELNGPVHCTMLASRLVSNGIPNLRHGLAAVLERHRGVEISKEEQRSDWSAPILREEQLVYAAKDADELIRLYPVLMQKLEKGKLIQAFDLECAALPALAQMWRTGLPWNKESLLKVLSGYEQDILELGNTFLVELDEALPLEHKLPRDEDGTFNLRAKAEGAVRLGTKRLAGFNLNSPKQLIEKFTALLGVVPLDPATGKPSAKRQALREHAADHAVIGTYLKWKRAEKRRQMAISILEHLRDDGYVRSSYMQLGADTGRMSCREPNTQQIPRDSNFRACVQAPPGWLFVDADFSQMELRLAAAVAKDKRMVEAFKAGEDLHTITSEQLGCDRQTAKAASFGLLYGSGATGLRNYAGGMGMTMTKDEAAVIRDSWLNTYSGIRNWHRSCSIKSDDTQGDRWAEVRVPVSGFRRYLPDKMNRLTVRANTPIQGAGAAILKSSLSLLWPLVKAAGEEEVRIAACVHDEILCLVREDVGDKWASVLKRCMEEAEARWLGEIPALAEVRVGRSWADTH